MARRVGGQERFPVEVARGFLGRIRFRALVTVWGDHIAQGADLTGFEFDFLIQTFVPCVAVDLTTR